VNVKSTLLAAAFLICCSIPASAASLDLLTPYLSGQYFTWEERSGGRRILRESGPLFSAGALVGGITDFSMTIRGRGELFGGNIGYDGETQAPTVLPIKTDVAYFGTREEVDLGYRAAAGGFRIEPFAGLGYRWWLRDLQDTRASNGEQVSGYTELWQTAYARAGARGRYLNPSGVSMFAEAGAKYPFFTGNSVDFAGFGTTTFHPVGRWSAFAEGGVEWQHLRFAVCYEGFRYSHSATELVGSRFFLQPDSSSDTLGLSVGWAFR
jgi:hypothetical protein